MAASGIVSSVPDHQLDRPVVRVLPASGEPYDVSLATDPSLGHRRLARSRRPAAVAAA